MKFLQIFRKSLLFKISLLVVLTITTFLGGVGWFQYQMSAKALRQSLQERAEFAADRLSVGLRQALFDYAIKTIHDILQAEMKPQIIAGLFIAENEKVLYGFVRDAQEQVVAATTMLPPEEYIVAHRQIQNNENSVLGEVRVFVSLQSLQEELRRSLLSITAQVCVLDALIIVVLTLLIRTMLISPLTKAVDFVTAVADGDVTKTLPNRRHDEIGRLLHAINGMVSKLQEILREVKNGAQNMATGSQQVSDGTAEISHGATVQSASVEEISASMEQMAANIRQNSDNAMQTEKIAVQAAVDAKESGRAVMELVKAIQKIAKKIALIEEVVAQTRVLSLNATIEAARAQEYGKGFAVVATEVRHLSSQIQKAAQAITKLTKSGVILAENASKMLINLVPDIQKTAELVQEISAASREQNTGAEQINNAIQQLDRVIQQNAANTEEMASSAEELAAQAELLQQMVVFFKTDEAAQALPEHDAADNAPPASRRHKSQPPHPAIGKEPSLAEDTPSNRMIDLKKNNEHEDTLDDEFERY